MNRREMFRCVGAIAVAGTSATTLKPKKYGRLDVEGHLRHKQATGQTLHVWLDGRDVTSDCSLADDIQGYVHVITGTPDSHRYWLSRADSVMVDGHTMRVYGVVRIAPGVD